MMFSKQKFYCQSCGKEMFVAINAAYGAKYCNQECCDEYHWKETLSIMGKEYYPKPKKESK